MSGCTIPGTDIEIPFLGGSTISLDNDIIVITSLDAIPNKVTTPQNIRLIASIQNRGSREFSTAPDTGIDTDLDRPIRVELFDYCQGLFNKPEVEGCSLGESSGSTCDIMQLLPEETTEVIWLLEPKEDIKLITRCDLKVSVSYPYTTDGLTTVHFINYDEYLRQLAAGSPQSRTSTITLGEGPVKAWYEINDKQPIPVTGGVASVSLEIENRGAGFVTSGTEKPSVKLIGTENSIFDEPFQSAAQGECSFTEDVEIALIQGKRSLPCHIKQLDDVVKETTNQLTTQISYRYEFRKETRVTVEPKFQA